MKFYERITKIIFPDEYVFNNDYYRGQTIMNQPQLIGLYLPTVDHFVQ